MTKQPVYKLVLFPESVEYVPADWQKIENKLREVGASLSEGQKQFFVGEEFLRLITFLGCSPHIKIEPDDNSNNDFCYIELSHIEEKIRFRRLSRDLVARCPKCRKNIDHGLENIEQLQQSAMTLVVDCLNCQTKTPIYSLDWRHSAAFAHCFIDITHIYPQEAIPGDELLTALEKVSNQKWDYFFSE